MSQSLLWHHGVDTDTKKVALAIAVIESVVNTAITKSLSTAQHLHPTSSKSLFLLFFFLSFYLYFSHLFSFRCLFFSLSLSAPQSFSKLLNAFILSRILYFVVFFFVDDVTTPLTTLLCRHFRRLVIRDVIKVIFSRL